MPLFEVAVITKPSKNDADSGKSDAVLLAPTAIVARDQQAAILKATKLLKEDVDLDKCEVLARPF